MINRRLSEIYVDAQIPKCLKWDYDEVAAWIGYIGFPQYKVCFRKNFIDGRKLIIMDASKMPKIGIFKFDDILALTRAIREELGISKPSLRMYITVGDPKVIFLEQKQFTGERADGLTFSRFLKVNAKVFS